MESADVVIIGGGAVGASTAFQLALRGVTDVVLLERGQLAGGSTAKSAGGARLQFADELNITIGERGMRDFEHWPEVIGPHVEFVPDIAFHQVGYLFLLGDDEQVATFRKALEVQHRLGVPSRLLTPQEAAGIVPQLVIDDLVAATFCPRDGHMSPEAVVQGYAAAAAAHGVTVRQGSSATGITVSDGTITAVETDQGTIATDTVVCASGAWSGEVCAMAGVDVPVTGEARWMWFSPENGGLGDDLPLTIDFTTGFYTHREGPGIVFGGRESEIEDLAVHALHRLPVIGELPIQSQWWGYYENSPDHNAIVGATDQPGLYVGTGFSGHGFQQAPAVGEHLAELITGRPVSIPMEPFGLDRFRRGEQRVESFIV